MEIDEKGSISGESMGESDASTIIYDDFEKEQLASMINVNLKELEKEAAGGKAVPGSNDEEEDYAGAVGLWGKDFQLQCFQAAPVVMPSFLSNALQGSAYEPAVDRRGAKEKRFLLDDLAKAYDEPITYTKETQDCSSCKRPVDEGRGIVLKECLHVFCRKCLIDEIKINPKAIMTCPSKIVCCTAEVRDEEIKSLLTPEAYEQYNLEMLYKMNIIDTAELVYEYEYVENKNDFNCDICLQSIPSGEGVVLKNCLHQYCKPCLRNYIEHSETVTVPCPFRDDDGLRCIGTLVDSEIRSLVSLQAYLVFLKKSLAEGEAECPNAYHCKTPDCPAWLDIDEMVQEFDCPTCNTRNCVVCRAVHQGATCEDYQEMVNGPGRRAQENAATEDQVRGMLIAKTAQNCPRCGIVVQRVDGCRHMTCTACKHEFQWTGL